MSDEQTPQGEIDRRLASLGWRFVCGRVEGAAAYAYEAKVFDDADGLVLAVHGSSEEEALDQLVTALRNLSIA